MEATPPHYLPTLMDQTLQSTKEKEELTKEDMDRFGFCTNFKLPGINMDYKQNENAHKILGGGGGPSM